MNSIPGFPDLERMNEILYEFVDYRVLGASLVLYNWQVIGAINALTLTSSYTLFMTAVWINPGVTAVYSRVIPAVFGVENMELTLVVIIRLYSIRPNPAWVPFLRNKDNLYTIASS